jgi:uncharacterized repeat protein (TIGR02543 family)
MARFTSPRLTKIIQSVCLFIFFGLGIFVNPVFANSSVQLTWEASPDPDLLGYKVHMGTSSGSYPMINDAGLTQSFLFQNLADGKTYYFIVTAYDQMQNQSVPSEEVNVQIPDSTSPTPPENVTLAASSNSEISFTWTASRDNVGVTGYQVARDTVVIGQAATTTFTDTTTSPGNTYTYTVQAMDASGNASAWSLPLEVTVASQDTTAPSVPQNLTLDSASTTQVAFSWAASTDNVAVTGYQVARNTVVIGQTATTAFVDATTSAGTTYTYTVQAMDASGNSSGWSQPLQATTPQDVALLTVSTSGKGSVTSSPNSINCPKQNCTGNYPLGTVVTLTATPGSGWTFSGWSESCAGTDVCTLSLTGNQTVKANFSKGSKSDTGGGKGNGGGEGRPK